MLKIREIARHRNGVGGEPFHAVTFTDKRDLFVASVFESAGHVAIYKVDLLPAVTFAVNSWRGDVYEDWLRRQISAWEGARYGAMLKEQPPCQP